MTREEALARYRHDMAESGNPVDDLPDDALGQLVAFNAFYIKALCREMLSIIMGAAHIGWMKGRLRR